MYEKSNSVRADGRQMTKDETITANMELLIAILRRLEGRVILKRQELDDAHDFTYQVIHEDDGTVTLSLLTLNEGNAMIDEFAKRGKE